MHLLNLFNHFREIYLFCRNEKGEQEIKTLNSFFPYFYVPDSSGNFKSYKGESLRRIIVSAPHEVSKNRSLDALEADILFTKRYLIDKVTNIEKTIIKYAFIDIEVLSNELPNVQEAKQPISCISIYNSFSKTIQTFYLGDYDTEFSLIEAFIHYMKQEKFDIWFSWNVKFDYNYLYNRVPDFAEKISVIGKTRYGDETTLYPAGISIIDYLGWFQKVTLNREKSYALNDIAQKYLDEPSAGKFKFGTLSLEIKEKNINDVNRMVKIEEKFKLIAYYDEVRRLAKVEWEDLVWNSRVVDMLLLQEAFKQKVALPMKPHDVEKEEFEGAYRECYAPGAHFDIGKYDLTSAYPFAIIDFCLDPANILESGGATNTTDIITIDGTLFKQNAVALLPTVVKRLITLKNDIKQKLSTLTPNTEEHKDTKTKYNAIKSVVNSAYGVMGSQYFRLYSKKVASATTFLVRDLLHYIKEECEKVGHSIIYVDTDSVFIDSKENLTEYLNNLVQTWAQTRYGKTKVNIEFEYEGQYEKLLILTKCRYIGYLRTPKGVEEEIKGVEAKRKDSTIFTKSFQKELINKILNKEEKTSIFHWIKDQIELLKTRPLKDISFPCKLARQPEAYKNIPIFVRALRNTPGFDKKVGDPFYYIFMEGKDDSKKDLVMAFDEEAFEHIDKSKINWETIIKRNVIMKLDTIFEAMKWNVSDVIELPKKKPRVKKVKEQVTGQVTGQVKKRRSKKNEEKETSKSKTIVE
jgi:DNA polymerase elongation subunit (family B)